MQRKILNDIDLTDLVHYLKEELVKDFTGASGVEHYRLLNYMCKGKKLVYDIGTYKGSSSIAMSSAKKVVSYTLKILE